MFFFFLTSWFKREFNEIIWLPITKHKTSFNQSDMKYYFNSWLRFRKVYWLSWILRVDFGAKSVQTDRFDLGITKQALLSSLYSYSLRRKSIVKVKHIKRSCRKNINNEPYRKVAAVPYKILKQFGHYIVEVDNGHLQYSVPKNRSNVALNMTQT